MSAPANPFGFSATPLPLASAAVNTTPAAEAISSAVSFDSSKPRRGDAAANRKRRGSEDDDGLDDAGRRERAPPRESPDQPAPPARLIDVPSSQQPAVSAVPGAQQPERRKPEAPKSNSAWKYFADRFTSVCGACGGRHERMLAARRAAFETVREDLLAGARASSRNNNHRRNAGEDNDDTVNIARRFSYDIAELHVADGPSDATEADRGDQGTTMTDGQAATTSDPLATLSPHPNKGGTGRPRGVFGALTCWLPCYLEAFSALLDACVTPPLKLDGSGDADRPAMFDVVFVPAARADDSPEDIATRILGQLQFDASANPKHLSGTAERVTSAAELCDAVCLRRWLRSVEEAEASAPTANADNGEGADDDDLKSDDQWQQRHLIEVACSRYFVHQVLMLNAKPPLHPPVVSGVSSWEDDPPWMMGRPLVQVLSQLYVRLMEDQAQRTAGEPPASSSSSSATRRPYGDPKTWQRGAHDSSEAALQEWLAVDAAATAVSVCLLRMATIAASLPGSPAWLPLSAMTPMLLYSPDIQEGGNARSLDANVTSRLPPRWTTAALATLRFSLSLSLMIIAASRSATLKRDPMFGTSLAGVWRAVMEAGLPHAAPPCGNLSRSTVFVALLVAASEGCLCCGDAADQNDESIDSFLVALFRWVCAELPTACETTSHLGLFVASSADCAVMCRNSDVEGCSALTSARPRRGLLPAEGAWMLLSGDMALPIVANHVVGCFLGTTSFAEQAKPQLLNSVTPAFAEGIASLTALVRDQCTRGTSLLCTTEEDAILVDAETTVTTATHLISRVTAAAARSVRTTIGDAALSRTAEWLHLTMWNHSSQQQEDTAGDGSAHAALRHECLLVALVASVAASIPLFDCMQRRLPPSPPRRVPPAVSALLRSLGVPASLSARRTPKYQLTSTPCPRVDCYRQMLSGGHSSSIEALAAIVDRIDDDKRQMSPRGVLSETLLLVLGALEPVVLEEERLLRSATRSAATAGCDLFVSQYAAIKLRCFADAIAQSPGVGRAPSSSTALVLTLLLTSGGSAHLSTVAVREEEEVPQPAAWATSSRRERTLLPLPATPFPAQDSSASAWSSGWAGSTPVARRHGWASPSAGEVADTRVTPTMASSASALLLTAAPYPSLAALHSANVRLLCDALQLPVPHSTWTEGGEPIAGDVALAAAAVTDLATDASKWPFLFAILGTGVTVARDGGVVGAWNRAIAVTFFAAVSQGLARAATSTTSAKMVHSVLTRAVCVIAPVCHLLLTVPSSERSGDHFQSALAAYGHACLQALTLSLVARRGARPDAAGRHAPTTIRSSLASFERCPFEDAVDLSDELSASALAAFHDVLVAVSPRFMHATPEGPRWVAMREPGRSAPVGWAYRLRDAVEALTVDVLDGNDDAGTDVQLQRVQLLRRLLSDPAVSVVARDDRTAGSAITTYAGFSLRGRNAIKERLSRMGPPTACPTDRSHPATVTSLLALGVLATVPDYAADISYAVNCWFTSAKSFGDLRDAALGVGVIRYGRPTAADRSPLLLKSALPEWLVMTAALRFSFQFQSTGPKRLPSSGAATTSTPMAASQHDRYRDALGLIVSELSTVANLAKLPQVAECAAYDAPTVQRHTTELALVATRIALYLTSVVHDMLGASSCSHNIVAPVAPVVTPTILLQCCGVGVLPALRQLMDLWSQCAAFKHVLDTLAASARAVTGATDLNAALEESTLAELERVVASSLFAEERRRERRTTSPRHPRSPQPYAEDSYDGTLWFATFRTMKHADSLCRGDGAATTTSSSSLATVWMLIKASASLLFSAVADALEVVVGARHLDNSLLLATGLEIDSTLSSLLGFAVKWRVHIGEAESTLSSAVSGAGAGTPLRGTSKRDRRGVNLLDRSTTVMMDPTDRDIAGDAAVSQHFACSVFGCVSVLTQLSECSQPLHVGSLTSRFDDMLQTLAKLAHEEKTVRTGPDVAMNITDSVLLAGAPPSLPGNASRIVPSALSATAVLSGWLLACVPLRGRRWCDTDDVSVLNGPPTIAACHLRSYHIQRALTRGRAILTILSTPAASALTVHMLEAWRYEALQFRDQAEDLHGALLSGSGWALRVASVLRGALDMPSSTCPNHHDQSLPESKVEVSAACVEVAISVCCDVLETYEGCWARGAPLTPQGDARQASRVLATHVGRQCSVAGQILCWMLLSASPSPRSRPPAADLSRDASILTAATAPRVLIFSDHLVTSIRKLLGLHLVDPRDGGDLTRGGGGRHPHHRTTNAVTGQIAGWHWLPLLRVASTYLTVTAGAASNDTIESHVEHVELCRQLWAKLRESPSALRCLAKPFSTEQRGAAVALTSAYVLATPPLPACPLPEEAALVSDVLVRLLRYLGRHGHSPQEGRGSPFLEPCRLDGGVAGVARGDLAEVATSKLLHCVSHGLMECAKLRMGTTAKGSAAMLGGQTASGSPSVATSAASVFHQLQWNMGAAVARNLAEMLFVAAQTFQVVVPFVGALSSSPLHHPHATIRLKSTHVATGTSAEKMVWSGMDQNDHVAEGLSGLGDLPTGSDVDDDSGRGISADGGGGGEVATRWAVVLSHTLIVEMATVIAAHVKTTLSRVRTQQPVSGAAHRSSFTQAGDRRGGLDSNPPSPRLDPVRDTPTALAALHRASVGMTPLMQSIRGATPPMAPTAASVAQAPSDSGQSDPSASSKAVLHSLQVLEQLVLLFCSEAESYLRSVSASYASTQFARTSGPVTSKRVAATALRDACDAFTAVLQKHLSWLSTHQREVSSFLDAQIEGVGGGVGRAQALVAFVEGAIRQLGVLASRVDVSGARM